MTGNYFKVGIRLLMRQKGYALLNVIGLMLGIVVFVFIYLYVESELRYDRHWSDSQRIYRITNEFALDGRFEKIALTPFRLAQDLRTEFPGVEEATNLFFTDPSIHPNSMVISSETAQKIFKGKPAVGQVLRTILREYVVTGVIHKAGKPSHLNFDALVSVSSLSEDELKMLKRDYFWMTNDFERLGEAEYIQSEKLNVSGSLYYFFEPLDQVHFNTSLMYDSPTNVESGHQPGHGQIAQALPRNRHAQGIGCRSDSVGFAVYSRIAHHYHHRLCARSVRCGVDDATI